MQDAEELITDAEAEEGMKLLIENSRTDFIVFLNTLWPQCDKQNYVISKCHMQLAELIQLVLEGKAPPNQAVSWPPQHGKSRLISVRAVAWALGAFPTIAVAMTGFSHSLLVTFVHEVQAIIDSDIYRMVFPNVDTVFGRNRSDEKHFSNGSSLVVKSTGSPLIGRKVDLLIIDDPHAGREAAESENSRKKVRQWYFGNCKTRMAPNGRQFLIMTRWHKQDLVGTLTDPDFVKNLEAEGFPEQVFQVTNYPALAKANDPLGREEGEALFPEQRDRKFLEAIRATMPAAYEWESQYQGNPQTSGSGQVDTSKLLKVEMKDIPEGCEFVRGWDTALTENKASDYSAGPLLAYHKEKDLYYIVDVIRKKLVWPKLKPLLVAQALKDKEEFGLQRIGMECVLGFSIGYDEVRPLLLGEVKVEKRNPTKDKLLRAMPWFNKVEAGKVFMVRGDWNRDFLTELQTFPDGDHDDQIDGMSICYEMVSKRQTVQYA